MLFRWLRIKETLPSLALLSRLQPLGNGWLGNARAFQLHELLQVGAHSHVGQYKDEGHAAEGHVGVFDAVVGHVLKHAERSEGQSGSHSSVKLTVEHAHSHDHKHAHHQHSASLADHDACLPCLESVLLHLELARLSFLLVE